MLVEVVIDIDYAFDNLSLGEQKKFIFEHLDVLDIEIDEDITIYTEADKFLSVKEELDKLGYDKYIMSEVTFIPDNYISLDEETTEKAVALIEALEDLDDVQNVYHNLEM